VLRTWSTDPGVAFFYDGTRSRKPSAQRITLINTKNEAVSLFFDIDTHLPIKEVHLARSRGKERNVEEEISTTTASAGVDASLGFTRYFMATCKSAFAIRCASNQNPSEAMSTLILATDPNRRQGSH